MSQNLTYPDPSGPQHSAEHEPPGELRPLLSQLSSQASLLETSGDCLPLAQGPIRDVPSLRAFLLAYHTQHLLGCELPAVCQACIHASRQHARELLEVDQAVSKWTVTRFFGAASRQIGQAQLKRLQPLRGERVVQRYQQAVQEGRAQGWHPVVYGLTLAIFSVPMRQGLLHYARRTLHGLAGAAARPIRLPESDYRPTLDEIGADLPRRIEELLAQSGFSPFPGAR